MRRLALALLLAGCAARPEAGAAPLEELAEGAHGHDAPPRMVARGRDAIASVELAGATVYVDPERRLWLADDRGERMLAAEVGGRPVFGEGVVGEGIVAWSEPGEDLASSTIRVLRSRGSGGQEIETVARAPGLMSPVAVIAAGVLAPEVPDGSGRSPRTGGTGAGEPIVAGVLAPEVPDGSGRSPRTGGTGAGEPIIERIALVGAANGGVAGLWIAQDGQLACVTNCALRAGGDWGDAYVPPPGDGVISIDGDRVSFVDATGVARVATIPAGGAR